MFLVYIIVIELAILFGLSHFIRKALHILLYILIPSKSIRILIITLILLPGTIIHELAHLFTAGILLVPIGKVSFLPSFKQVHQSVTGLTLGHVEIAQTDPFRRYLVGAAPLIFGVASLSLLLWTHSLVAPQFDSILSQILVILMYGYLIFSISNSMFSSKKDLEGIVVFIPLIVGLILVLFYFNLFPQPSPQFMATIEPLLNQVVIMLALVIGVNLGLLLLANTLKSSFLKIRGLKQT